MTQRHAFLDAILANPADDTPRLVFADWLEEHGEADRAAFIRRSCAIEPHVVTLTAHESTHTWTATMDQWENLHKNYGGKPSRNPIPELGHPTGEDIECWFRRGFVARVDVACVQWLLQGERLLRKYPLQQVRMTQIAAGRMRREGDTLVCPVHAASESRLSFSLDVNAGSLWYTMDPDGRHDAFMVRVEPLYHANPLPPARHLTIEDAFREHWNRMRVDRANDQRILHGNPDAPAPQGIIHTARRPR